MARVLFERHSSEDKKVSQYGSENLYDPYSQMIEEEPGEHELENMPEVKLETHVHYGRKEQESPIPTIEEDAEESVSSSKEEESHFKKCACGRVIDCSTKEEPQDYFVEEAPQETEKQLISGEKSTPEIAADEDVISQLELKRSILDQQMILEELAASSLADFEAGKLTPSKIIAITEMLNELTGRIKPVSPHLITPQNIYGRISPSKLSSLSIGSKIERQKKMTPQREMQQSITDPFSCKQLSPHDISRLFISKSPTPSSEETETFIKTSPGIDSRKLIPGVSPGMSPSKLIPGISPGLSPSKLIPGVSPSQLSPRVSPSRPVSGASPSRMLPVIAPSIMVPLPSSSRLVPEAGPNIMIAAPSSSTIFSRPSKLITPTKISPSGTPSILGPMPSASGRISPSKLIATSDVYQDITGRIGTSRIGLSPSRITPTSDRDAEIPVEKISSKLADLKETQPQTPKKYIKKERVRKSPCRPIDISLMKEIIAEKKKSSLDYKVQKKEERVTRRRRKKRDQSRSTRKKESCKRSIRKNSRKRRSSRSKSLSKSRTRKVKKSPCRPFNCRPFNF